MTKRKQRELNWEEIPPQSGDDFDFDLEIGDQNEADMAAMHCSIVGRVDPLIVDETVFSPLPPALTPVAEIARDTLLDDSRPLAQREGAAGLLGQQLRPRLRPGQQRNENVRRFELVLSAYAAHGDGSDGAVARSAAAEGVGEEWFKKWRRLLPRQLLVASQAMRRVATYGAEGLRYSDPLPRHLWGRRYGLIKASERREAPERWADE